MNVRPATYADVTEIVLTHQAAFPSFFLTQLGPSFLRAYYRLVIEFDGGICIVADCDGIVAGFVAGFLGPERFYREMSRRKLHFALPVLLGLLRKPSNLPRVLERSKRIKLQQCPTGMDCELSSVGVDRRFAGSGIGRQLVRAFLEEVFKRGAKGVYLTTDAIGNEGVNAFYQKLGFQLMRTFITAEGRQMNEYIFPRHQYRP